MSPRRQDSQETLLDELVDIGDDKLDGTLPPLHFQSCGSGLLGCHQPSH